VHFRDDQLVEVKHDVIFDRSACRFVQIRCARRAQRVGQVGFELEELSEILVTERCGFLLLTPSA